SALPAHNYFEIFKGMVTRNYTLAWFYNTSEGNRYYSPSLNVPSGDDGNIGETGSSSETSDADKTSNIGETSNISKT
ncbi:30369_t:CDS:2, partial [Gigaspora margarita]